MNDVSTPEQHTKSQQLYWILQVAGWGLYTLLMFSGVALVPDLPWGKSALELIFFGGLGLAISHLLRDFVRRHNWADLSIPRLAARIVVASFVVGTPLGIMTQISDVSALQDAGPLLQKYAPALSATATVTIKTLMQVPHWAVLYVIWLTLYFAVVGVREYRSARLTQSELTRALQLSELRLLKSQLNPHFLFNALNTVRSLAGDNPSRAQSAVTRLANTLRYTLSSRHSDLVTFGQELDMVTDYLELESMRFEDRLRIEMDVAANATSVYIPVMLLQTLVENAIKHGIAELPSGGLIKITAVLENEMLSVDLENPRPAAPILTTGEGVGLRNARERLRLLFGTRATFDLDLSKPSVATARLRIPQQR